MTEGWIEPENAESVEWERRRNEARSEGRPFNEPSPAERKPLKLLEKVIQRLRRVDKSE